MVGGCMLSKSTADNWLIQPHHCHFILWQEHNKKTYREIMSVNGTEKNLRLPSLPIELIVLEVRVCPACAKEINYVANCKERSGSK